MTQAPDWADEAAKRLMPFKGFNDYRFLMYGTKPEADERIRKAQEESRAQTEKETDDIAAALRTAYRRGRVDGMREAADMLKHDRLGFGLCDHEENPAEEEVVAILRTRADEIERG